MMTKTSHKRNPMKPSRLHRRAILYLRLLRLLNERVTGTLSPQSPKMQRLTRFLLILCRTLIHLLLPILPLLIRRIGESDWTPCEAK